MLTKPQFRMMWTAFTKGGVLHYTQCHMGGASRRMRNRLIADGLLSNRNPFPITRKGMMVLRDACHARWAKHGCMATQDDLKDIEAAL